MTAPLRENGGVKTPPSKNGPFKVVSKPAVTLDLN